MNMNKVVKHNEIVKNIRNFKITSDAEICEFLNEVFHVIHGNNYEPIYKYEVISESCLRIYPSRKKRYIHFEINKIIGGYEVIYDGMMKIIIKNSGYSIFRILFRCFLLYSVLQEHKVVFGVTLPLWLMSLTVLERIALKKNSIVFDLCYGVFFNVVLMNFFEFDVIKSFLVFAMYVLLYGEEWFNIIRK